MSQLLRCDLSSIAACLSLSLLMGCANAELTQAELGDINKLLKQRATASKTERSEAAQWAKRGEEASGRRRWDLASKMYGEASLRYPTFVYMRGAGDAIARSDRKRDTMTQTLAAQRAAFVSAADMLRTAVLLAEKLPDEATAEQLTAVRAQIACIEAYEGGANVTNATCEPVASVLARVRAQKY